MPRYRLGLLLGFWLVFIPSLARATDLTTVLNPGYLKWETDIDYHVLEVFGFVDDQKVSYGVAQVVYPSRLHYGLAQGVELAFSLPLSSRILASGSDQTLANRIWNGIGDLEGGMKFKLLSDTEDTPAVFVESLFKIPTGRSRFRDFVRTLDDPNYPISGTDAGVYDLILKGIISMFLNPLELYLQLKIDILGGDDFMVNSVHEHIDYGNIVSLMGGAELDVLDNLTLAAELLEISTAASIWTRDGVNALELSGKKSSALMAQTRTRGGIPLGNLTELYLGPTLTWTFLPATQFKLGLLFGLSPDSENFRATAGLSTAFMLGRVVEFKRGYAQAGKDSTLAATTAEEAPANSTVLMLQPQLNEALESGNRMRFIARQTDKAHEARSQGKLNTALREWNLILMQYPDYQPAQTAYEQTRQELNAALQVLLLKAATALKTNDLFNAVRTWREVLVLDPRQETALGMLRDYAYQIHERAKQLYLQGTEFYARGDYPNAIARWEEAKVFTPADSKLEEALQQTKKKIHILKQLGQ